MPSKRGTTSKRRSRGDVAPETTAFAAPTAAVTVAAGACWADFMADEDNTQDDKSNKNATSTSTSTSPNTTTSNPNKRAKTTSASTTTTTTTTNDTTNDTTTVYDLPVRPRRCSPGVLAMTGTLDAGAVGRQKRPLEFAYDLQEPTVLGRRSVFSASPAGVSFVAASSAACHSIVIDANGVAYAWGRNEFGQCGITESAGGGGDNVGFFTKIDGMDDKVMVGAAVGKSHSILIQDNGTCYSVGHNKYGQCGVNTNTEHIHNWKKCVVQGGAEDGDTIQIVQASCGDSFSVLLDSSGFLYSAGLAEFGQLGNGETGERLITSNKVQFDNSNKFRRRTLFVQTDPNEPKETPVALDEDVRIGHVACGRQHTVAVEAPYKDNSSSSSSSSDSTTAPPPPSRRVFTWGCGGYGVLGHGVQKDQYLPQVVSTFQSAIFCRYGPVRVAAGAHCTLVLTSNGHVYYSGMHKTNGEATMRPALVEVLANNQHVVTALGGGNQTVFCSTANGVTVSWGHGNHGELGYGANKGKSASKTRFVDKLDKVLVTDLACGYGHTLFIIRDDDEEDKKLLKQMANIEKEDLKKFIQKCEKTKKEK